MHRMVHGSVDTDRENVKNISETLGITLHHSVSSGTLLGVHRFELVNSIPIAQWVTCLSEPDLHITI